MAEKKTTDAAKDWANQTASEMAALPALFDLGGALAEIERRSESFDATEWEALAQFCAKWILHQVGLLDPRWARLIEAAKIETHRDDWKLLGSWIARVLEQAQHLNAPRHPYFEAGSGRLKEQICEWPECGEKFMPEFAGQRFHNNTCGSKFFA